MARRKFRPDFYSGVPWVYVTPEQARSLPQGKLNLTLYLISLYFVVIGLVKFYLVLSIGAGFLSALLNGLWPLLTGLGLLCRVPWSIIMAVGAGTLTGWFLVRGAISVDAGQAELFVLFDVIINVGIVFYLVDADRPNLIYRHRFRKYSYQDETPQ